VIHVWKKDFFDFLAVCARESSKLAKSANMTLQVFFHNILKLVSKNAEFDADFKSIKKRLKKFLQKSY
jgi:hypothetical protein